MASNIEISPPQDKHGEQNLDKKTSPIALEVSNLSVVRSGKVIIHDINLKMKSGEFVGIVGPNGSGKSTLVLSILGFLKPQTGEIQIYGNAPLSKTLNGRIGWVSQAASNLPKEVTITVEELVMLGTVNSSNMLFWPNSDRKKRVKEAIEKVGLKEHSTTDVSKLSGGQRQRAVIAKALASNAEFIFLDEPLVGVDRKTRNSLLKLLDDLCHNENKTILMISHDLTAMRQTAHRIIYLEEEIKYDGPSSEFPNFAELAAIRGIQQVHDVNILIKESDGVI